MSELKRKGGERNGEVYKKNQKENRNIKTKQKKKEIVTLLKEGEENNRKVGEKK